MGRNATQRAVLLLLGLLLGARCIDVAEAARKSDRDAALTSSMRGRSKRGSGGKVETGKNAGKAKSQVFSECMSKMNENMGRQRAGCGGQRCSPRPARANPSLSSAPSPVLLPPCKPKEEEERQPRKRPRKAGEGNAGDRHLRRPGHVLLQQQRRRRRRRQQRHELWEEVRRPPSTSSSVGCVADVLLQGPSFTRPTPAPCAAGCWSFWALAPDHRPLMRQGDGGDAGQTHAQMVEPTQPPACHALGNRLYGSCVQVSSLL